MSTVEDVDDIDTSDDEVVIGCYEHEDTVVFYDLENPDAWYQIDAEQVVDPDWEVLQ